MMKKGFFSVVFLFTFFSHIEAIGWGADQRWTIYPGGNWTGLNNAHPLATIGDTAYALWYFSSNNTGYNYIYSQVYNNSTWSGPNQVVEVSWNRNAWHHSVACDSIGQAYVVYESNIYKDPLTLQLNYEIYYLRGYMGNWSPPQRITNDPDGFPYYSWYPCVTVDISHQVHVVWQDCREGNTFKIFYKKLTGGSWTPDICLTPQGTSAYFPSITSDRWGRLHLVWQDMRTGEDEIFYKRFNGNYWEPDTQLTNTGGYSRHPTITCDTLGDVDIVWEDKRDKNWEIYWFRCNNSIWPPQPQRLTIDGTDSRYPSLASEPSGILHLAWQDNRNGNYKIFYKKFDGVWSADTCLSSGDSVSIYPSIAVDKSKNIHLVWSDYRDELNMTPEIYYKNYDSGIKSPPSSPGNLTFEQDNLKKSWPNPFTEKTLINYIVGSEQLAVNCQPSTANRQQVSLKIYNLAGQLVKTLVNEPQAPGEYTVQWNGTAENGQSVASGFYFCRLQVNNQINTKRLLLIR
ncbi:MAG: FlgD immunoglobulin-like domain containing protein [Candidatus Edwardsbacteria bacterium]